MVLSHWANSYFIGNKKTLDKVDRVARCCNFRMHPRHGKISSRRTAAVNPLLFDFNRLLIIPPMGGDGMNLLHSCCDAALLVPLVMLFHCIGKACGYDVARLSAPRLFYFFQESLLCRKTLEGVFFPRHIPAHAGRFEEGGSKFCFF